MAATMALALPFQVSAQTAGEIIVTTTKRDTLLQDVPVSVGVVDRRIVEDLNIKDLTQLQDFVPGFSVQSTFGNWSVRIRGVGSGVTNTAFSSSVGVFVDDVYCGRSRCLEGGFLDVDRVEVARGPQGALFGTSTIAGAISLISAKPTEEFEGYVQGGYEFENDGYSMFGVVSGPLPFGDSLRGRLAAKYEEIGGWMDNPITGDDEPEADRYAVRGSLAWDATEDVSFDFKLEFADKEDASSIQLVSSGLFGALSTDPGKEFRRDDIRRVSTGNDRSEADDMDSFGAVLAMTADLPGEHTLRAIAGHWELDYDNYLDVDGTADLFLNTNLTEDYDQQSLELRLLSPTGGRFEYIVGGLYHQSDVQTEQVSNFAFLTLVPPFRPVPPGFSRNFENDSEIWSAFGQLTWHVTDRLRVIVDARYTDQKQDGFAYGIPVVFPDLTNPVEDTSGFSLDAPYRMKQTRDDEELDPALRLQYDFTDDIMAYVAWATGSKSGGMRSNDGNIGDELLAKDSAFLQKYIGQPTLTRPELAAGVTLAQGNGVFDFEEEEADNYELGVKMRFPDLRASLNITAFLTDFEDLQTSTYDGSNFIIANAASADIKGLELDGNWQATDNLGLSLGISLLDAEYDDFFGAECLVADESGAFRDPTCTDGSEDLSGVVLERTPDYTVNFTANYERPLTDALLFRGLFAIYFSDNLYIRQDLHPLGEQESYEKWDLRLGLADTADTWEVALVGRNLGDELTINHAFEIAGSNFVALGQGRTITLEGTWRF
jgi:iron complex outermembrane receptor protein